MVMNKFIEFENDNFHPGDKQHHLRHFKCNSLEIIIFSTLFEIIENELFQLRRNQNRSVVFIHFLHQ